MNPGLLGERQLWLPQDYGDPRNSGKNVFILIAGAYKMLDTSYSKPELFGSSNMLDLQL